MELTLILASLATLPLVSAETVLGAYVFHRHGDRTAKAWAPVNLTTLGANECYGSGTYFRNRYVASGASSPIFGLSSNVVKLSQIGVTAPVDNVLQSSAMFWTQGLYPPLGTSGNQTIANGSSYEAPLGGYQAVPINQVTSPTSATSSNQESSTWLQGSSGCNNAVVSSNNYLTSAEYLFNYNNTMSLYQGLLPVINTTYGASAANFKNAYAIYDYIHVATIDNASIPSSGLLTDSTLKQIQWLADDHEYNLAYNSTDTIRAIAGAVLAAQIVQQLNATLTGKGSQPLTAQFGAYGTFMAFFGLAGLTGDFRGIVDYASSMVFELVTNATVSKTAYPSASDVSVRFLFSNGSAALNPNGLTAYPLFGQSETVIPWTTFAAQMNKFAIGDSTSWCQACGNTTGVCATTTSSTTSSSATPSADSSSGSGISTAVGGVIGAMVTLAVILLVEALVYFGLGLKLVKKSAVAGAAAGAATAGSKA